MIDSLLEHLPRALAQKPWERLGLAEREYALVTLHRPALVDDPARLSQTISGLEEVSRIVPVLFPVHPRTRARIESLGLPSLPKRLVLVEPLGYVDFLGLEARARFVLTDSGGVQEETSALGTRCFTLRDSTERPVTVRLGTNTLLGLSPSRIGTVTELPLDLPHSEPIPLWDGRAGERAASVLLESLR
jgi:UDP-N-acetylglucosamine 2-epimerase (non-hydrolysing)